MSHDKNCRFRKPGMAHDKNCRWREPGMSHDKNCRWREPGMLLAGGENSETLVLVNALMQLG